MSLTVGRMWARWRLRMRMRCTTLPFPGDQRRGQRQGRAADARAFVRAATTLDVYADLFDIDLHAVAERLDSVVSGPAGEEGLAR
jgi:hypothetical protein